MKLLIKVGGTLLENDETRRSLAQQVTARAAAGDQTVVVHGGGKRLSRYLQKQGVQSEFRNGLRVTPREIMDAVLRIYAGEVNHRFLAELSAAGAKAVGLSGVDSGMVRAVQLDPELGAVGRVESVDPSVLNLLTEAGYLALVACVAGGADGAIFNVNADQMAAACGDGFEADRLIFLTDVAGVLDAAGKLIPSLTAAEAEALIADGTAEGGMEAKLAAAIGAVRGGAGEVRIAAGAEPDIVAKLASGEAEVGTRLTADN